MLRRVCTLGAVALLIVGIVLVRSGPPSTTFVFASTEPELPSGIYWLPGYRLLGIAVFVAGLVVLAATVGYAAGIRQGRSATK